MMGIAAGLILTTGVPSVAAQEGKNILMHDSEVPWADSGNSGLKIANLYGDPSVPGEAFVFRLTVPVGYTLDPHIHPIDEHMTVLEGALYVGLGTELDRAAAVAYGPGSYVMVAADEPAYMFADEETVVQVHGIGPLRTVPVGGE